MSEGRKLGRQDPSGLLRRGDPDGGASYYLPRPDGRGPQLVWRTTAEQEASGIREHVADAICAALAPAGRIGRQWRSDACGECGAPAGRVCAPWMHAGRA